MSNKLEDKIIDGLDRADRVELVVLRSGLERDGRQYTAGAKITAPRADALALVRNGAATFADSES